MTTEQTHKYEISEEMMHSGAVGCRGCGWSMIARHISSILGEDTVYVVPACCFSIIVGQYPMNAMKGNVVHTLFAAAASTATGIRAALDRQGKEHATVVVLAGDGSTFDIGLASVSGAAARNENILYICNNNGAYMNTGIQSSTATPYGASTTTDPIPDYKRTWPKDMMGIMTSHHIPYVATASPAYMEDFRNKIKKAKDMQGFRMIMVDGPCPAGHKTDPSKSISVSRLAVDTNLFPLYEVEDQRYTINVKPNQKIPVEKCLELQGRFRQLFKNGNSAEIQKIQDHADEGWTELLKKEGIETEEYRIME
jgi:pyruvate/2-oxoacid:ferredoxin oxidoreductase beta subunit